MLWKLLKISGCQDFKGESRQMFSYIRTQSSLPRKGWIQEKMTKSVPPDSDAVHGSGKGGGALIRWELDEFLMGGVEAARWMKLQYSWGRVFKLSWETSCEILYTVYPLTSISCDLKGKLKHTCKKYVYKIPLITIFFFLTFGLSRWLSYKYWLS